VVARHPIASDAATTSAPRETALARDAPEELARRKQRLGAVFVQP
jgi:hypothetical protein